MSKGLYYCGLLGIVIERENYMLLPLSQFNSYKDNKLMRAK